jgi:hypothetical protein
MRRRTAPIVNMGLVALVALAASLTGGCSLLPADYTLHASNATTLALTLVVNDQPVSVLEPGTSVDIPPGALPAMPWAVVVRTASGRVIATMPVAQGSIVDQRAIDGTGSYSAPAGGAALSCGRVTLWAGGIPPSGGGVALGVPGDCEP